jgi:photosystem II stability/assembly factor-like uncharacterized protein
MLGYPGTCSTSRVHGACAAYAIVLAALIVAAASSARANGAFSDSKAILLPRAHPHRIVTSSDIPGLLVSDDDGVSWNWVCEDAIGRFAGLFQLGPTPDEQLYAVTQAGLSISGDAGCSWQRPDGLVKRAGDVFADPSDSQHVLSIVETTVAMDSPLYGDVLVQSHDGGESFGPAMFSTSAASITGLEVARSDPSVIYLAMSSLQSQHPYLVRSMDAGETWRQIDLTAQLDPRPLIISILAVHPQDARTLYLRVSDGQQDALVISADGGETVHVAQRVSARMSAFLVRANGTLLLAGSDGQSFLSADGGESFGPWSSAAAQLHIEALGERNGVLYATTTSKLDGFALAASADDGAHWQPLLRLEHVRGPLACGSTSEQCQKQWAALTPSLPKLSGPALGPQLIVRSAPQPGAASGCSVEVGAQRVMGRDSWWLCAAVSLTCLRMIRARKREWRRDNEQTV